MPAWNNFSLIIPCFCDTVATYVISANIQKYLSMFPDDKVKCNSMNCLLSELIYYEVLIFSLKFIFSKEYYFHILLSLERFEWFLPSLLPVLNYGNDSYSQSTKFWSLRLMVGQVTAKKYYLTSCLKILSISIYLLVTNIFKGLSTTWLLK